jgi:aspartate racemase
MQVILPGSNGTLYIHSKHRFYHMGKYNYIVVCYPQLYILAYYAPCLTVYLLNLLKFIEEIMKSRIYQQIIFITLNILHKNMKTIGLIGGMSWESSQEYYRIINETVKETLGGLHSAQSIMYSFDFEEIEKLQHQGAWDKLTELMIAAVKDLENGGADFIIICTNTMHKMADEVQKNIQIPLLHIADATAEKIKAKGIKIVGLLGTKFTMEEDFYKGRLLAKNGIEVVVPSKRDRQLVHEIIYNELCLGKIEQSSKNKFKKIIQNLISSGAEGIILGCTEIPLLIKQDDVEVPIFDTTLIHARSAVEYALK